jgi:hypothetical protein
MKTNPDLSALQEEVKLLRRSQEIEMALEKVRTRTMARQHIDELQDAAIILFQQIKNPGIETGSCGFDIFDKKEKAATACFYS